jgi:hypothetical protein
MTDVIHSLTSLISIKYISEILELCKIRLRYIGLGTTGCCMGYYGAQINLYQNQLHVNL